MTTSKTWNNTSFPIPDNGDSRGTWGVNLSNFLKALADNALSKYGGSFQLTGADIDFGSSYGLIATYIKSKSSNIAQSGVIRLANNEGIGFRNAANGADKIFKLDASDKWAFGSSALSEAELSYLSGVTSAIQNQLNSKASSTDLTNHENDTSTHGVGTVAGLTESQVFTNKDIDGGTAANSRRITLPKDTYANLLLLTRKEGTVLYATDLDQVFVDDGTNLVPIGSGSGSGEKTYIENPSAANNTDGWAISGAGTFARTTTAANLPREFTTGTAFAFTSSINGEYVRYRFSLDDVDLGAKLKWVLDYISSTANFRLEMWKNSASNYGGSYIEIALENDSSGDSYLVAAASSANYRTTFDTDTTPYLELRIVHNGTGTDTIYFSDVLVGPGTRGTVPAQGKWETCTVTHNWGVNATVTAKRRQDGQNMEYDVNISLSGTPSTADLLLTLPSGDEIDTTAMSGSAAYVTVLGTARIYDSGAMTYPGNVVYSTTTVVRIGAPNGGTNLGIVNQAYPFTFGASDSINTKFSVPLTRLAGSVQTGPGIVEEFLSYYDSAATAANTNYTDQSKVSRSPLGSQFAAVDSTTAGGATTYEMNTLYPIQLDDELVFETSSDSGATFQLHLGLINGTSIYTQVAGNVYGIGLQGNVGSTKVRVVLGNYGRVPNNASYGGTGATWAGIAAGAYRWRVRKTKKAALPYKNASLTASGLISSEYASSEGDLGSITVGTGTWSAIDSKKYRWVKNGKQVTLWYRLESTTAASALVEFRFDLPSDCPTPLQFSTSGNSEWASSGHASSSTSAGGAIVKSTCNLYIGASGEKWIYHTQDSSATKIAWGCISYPTA
jgi:hypothetical protein